MSKGGFGSLFVDALSDQLTWTVTGSSPLSGTYHSKSDYLDQVLGPIQQRVEGSVTPILERILADGEWGAVYFRTEGQKGKNGADFSMQYCWLMRVVDGKIVEVKGWYDQKKLWDLFETDVGAKA